MKISSAQRSTIDSKETDPLIRVALLVEYVGSFFHGSQFQPKFTTVQGVLQNTLVRLNLKTSAVSFASRTDTNVHAVGQVAHFDLRASQLQHIPDLCSALNALLPETISVRQVHIDTGLEFNSRREAKAKWYRYSIYNDSTRSAWASRQASTFCRSPLNLPAMDQAARLLVGSFDFTSFKDSRTSERNNFCLVHHAKLTQNGNFITFDIVANRFLYKMVRNITGQLVAIGSTKHSLTPETILDVLAQCDRRQAAETAKPDGLTLMAIHYDQPFNFFETDSAVQTIQTLLKPMESLQNENLFRKAS